MNKGNPVITVLLCIVLFVFLAATSVAGILQNIISEDTIAEIISDIDAGVLVEELEIYERISEVAGEEIVEALGITSETISGVLDKEPFRDFIAGNTYELVDAIIHGRSSIAITQEEIMRLIRDSIPYIEYEFGISVPDEIFDEIEEVLYASELPDKITIDLNAVGISPGIDLEPIRWILLPSTFNVLLIISILVAVSMVFVNMLRLRLALLGIGATSGLLGILLFFAGVLLNTLVEMVFPSEGMIYRQLINAVLPQAQAAIRSICGALAGTGVLCILAYIIIRTIDRRRQAHEFCS